MLSGLPITLAQKQEIILRNLKMKLVLCIDQKTYKATL